MHLPVYMEHGDTERGLAEDMDLPVYIDLPTYMDPPVHMDLPVIMKNGACMELPVHMG